MDTMDQISVESRSKIVEEIENTIKTHGCATKQTPKEMEEEIFAKSTSKKGYFMIVSKLIHFLKNTKNAQNTIATESQKQPSEENKNTSSNAHKIVESGNSKIDLVTDEQYTQKLRDLQIYIPKLRATIQEMLGNEMKGVELNKLRMLLKLITDPSKKVDFSVLAQSERVLTKIFFDSADTSLSSSSTPSLSSESNSSSSSVIKIEPTKQTIPFPCSKTENLRTLIEEPYKRFLSKYHIETPSYNIRGICFCNQIFSAVTNAPEVAPLEQQFDISVHRTSNKLKSIVLEELIDFSNFFVFTFWPNSNQSYENILVLSLRPNFMIPDFLDSFAFYVKIPQDYPFSALNEWSLINDKLFSNESPTVVSLSVPVFEQLLRKNICSIEDTHDEISNIYLPTLLEAVLLSLNIL